MEDGIYDGLWRWYFFLFYAIEQEIPSSKHHEIQEFGQNYHISAMKINKIFVFQYRHRLAPLKYYQYLIFVTLLQNKYYNAL